MDINGISGGTGLKITPQKPAARRPVAASSTAKAQTGEDSPAREETAPKERAVFAVEDKKVVIRILDKQGKLIMQIPPEQAKDVKEELAEAMKHLFSKEA